MRDTWPEGEIRISRLMAINALHAGIDARIAGEPLTACPFNPNGTLPEQFAAIWWVKGWTRRRSAESDDD